MRRGFEALLKSVTRAGVPAVDAAARIVADAIRAEAPVEKGLLRESVQEGPHRIEGGSISATAFVPADGGHREDSTNTALHVIFGTRYTAPNNFVARGAALASDRASDRIADAVRAAIRNSGKD